MKITLFAAATAAALTVMAGAASAATVVSAEGQFGPLPVTDAATSYATRVPGVFTGIVDDNSNSSTATTFLDTFTFTVGPTPQEIAAGTTATSYDTTLSGDLYNNQSGSNIRAYQIFLYSGSPDITTNKKGVMSLNDSGNTLIDSTDLKTIDNKKGVYHYTLEDTLTAGDNYFLQADITVPKGDMGKYGLTAVTSPISPPVSAVPEPGTWLLMIAGVAMIGGMLRYGRRGGMAFNAA